MEGMFNPNFEILQQVIQLMEQGKIADNQQQKVVYDKIEEFSKSHEFYSYLVYILTSHEIASTVRHMAGVTLKSLVERNYEHLPEACLEFIKSALFGAFEDSDSAIRNAVGTLVTTIIYKGGFQKWPGLLSFLSTKLESTELGAVLNAIECLAKIVEDLRVNSENYVYLDSSKGGSQLNSLIRRLFVFCEPSTNTRLQLVALHTLNLCVLPMPAALAESLDLYLKLLLNNSVSKNKQIRHRAFQGILALTETRPKAIAPKLNEVITAVIKGVADQDYEVAKTACNFWLEYLSEDQQEQNEEDEETNQKMKILTPYLRELLPAVLKGLRFTNEDLMNILPSTQNVSNQSEVTDLDFIQEGNYDDEDGDNIGVEDNQDSKEASDSGEYTLRKICGRTIEKLSKYFRDEVYIICQPLIEECFYSPDWKIQEIGIICLGDIAEGSRSAVQAHLHSIIPSLLQRFEKEDAHYLLRSSILWTVCQYTSWMVENVNSISETIKKYLQCMVKGITQDKQHLQECACHCLKEFANQGSMILRPYLSDFLQVITVALRVYDNNSLSMMLDAVCTLVDEMKEEINNPQVLLILIPPILEKWSSMKSSELQIKPIAECLTKVAEGIEENFNPYIEFVFPKCFEMMNNFLEVDREEPGLQKERKHLFQRKQLFLAGVDLMSSIVFCSKNNFSYFAQTCNLDQVLSYSVESQDSEVRSYVFSLLAEIAHNCPAFLEEKALHYAKLVASNVVLFPSNLDPGNTYLNTCNNAIMCLNQFCMSFKAIMSPYAYEICLKIINIFDQSKKLNKIFGRNLSMALGSIALLDLNQVSKHLSSFIQKFCLSMKQYSSNTSDKEIAFEGLLKMAFTNPSGVINNMNYLVDAFMSYNDPPEGLKVIFKKLLLEYRSTLTNIQWNQFLNGSGFNQVVVRNIVSQYCQS